MCKTIFGKEMKFRFRLVVLLLATAAAAHSSCHNWALAGDGDAAAGSGGVDIWEGHEMLMESEEGRRNLYGEDKYLSYEALRKNAIPCGYRGHSYYDCRKRQRANPYSRGCNVITRCGRFTD